MSNIQEGQAIRQAARALEQALGLGTAVVLPDGEPDEPRSPTWATIQTGDQMEMQRVALALWDGAAKDPFASNVVWVLPDLPKTVVQNLRAGGANFVDLRRGWVRLRAPGLLVDRMDVTLPARTPSNRPLANPFGDRASLVPRVLAADPGKIWGTRELAAAARVSTMTASHVVRRLEQANVVLVEKAGKARRICLKSVESLIMAWSRYYDWSANRLTTYSVPMGDPERFLRRLPSTLGNRRWALTMHAAAALLAPIATWSKVHVYVDIQEREALQSMASALGWSEASDGRLVIAQPSYKESVWFGVRQLNDLPVVSNVQLILDLWDYPDRGREQAMHLLNVQARRAPSGDKG